MTPAALDCREMLAVVAARKGTDLLLSVGQPPQMRFSGNLMSLDYPALTPDLSKALVFQIMTEAQRKELETDLELDFSISLGDSARFRVNAFMQRGTISAAFRLIPLNFLTFDDLGLPPIVKEMSEQPRGLLLVTGPTGSGKSTTLAAMINHINETRNGHIITIEDPIEYVHPHKRCTVDQREVYVDTKSFQAALKSILRQDPDVVLLGEMRDMESIQAALTIAETGHICFATLHTNSCSQTLGRILDVFPGEKQQQVRTQLAMCLNGVMTQVLLPKIGGGLQLALEIMVATSAIKTLIRENKVHNVDNQIQLSSKYGMQTMNHSLISAVRNGLVREEDAEAVSPDKDDFRKGLVA